MGFRNRELRVHLAQLRGQDPASCTQGQMTYQLRRLRLHGLIVRRAGTHGYQVTERGLRVALFFTRSYSRLLRPGITEVVALGLPKDAALRQAFAEVETAMDAYASKANSDRKT